MLLLSYCDISKSLLWKQKLKSLFPKLIHAWLYISEFHVLNIRTYCLFVKLSNDVLSHAAHYIWMQDEEICGVLRCLHFLYWSCDAADWLLLCGVVHCGDSAVNALWNLIRGRAAFSPACSKATIIDCSMRSLSMKPRKSSRYTVRSGSWKVHRGVSRRGSLLVPPVLETWERARDTMVELAWEMPLDRRFSVAAKKTRAEDVEEGVLHCMFL